MNPLKKLSIVIVNWNTGQQLANLIDSIAKYHCESVFSVVIIDNASSDDSLAQINDQQIFPFQLQIVRNICNRGFGAACNQGAALIASEYLLFLNPDTRLFDHSLSVPLKYLEDQKNQKVGIVGIQLLDEQNRIARSCARFPTLGMFVAQALGLSRLRGLQYLNVHMSDWAHDETRVVDHVIGAFFFIRRSVFQSLGGFDELFFVYLEDLDLSLRARQSGYLSVYLADAQMFHLGGGASRQIKARRLFYSLNSKLLYGFKHFSQSSAWVLLLVTLVIEIWTRLALALLKRSWRDAYNTIHAYGLLVLSLPQALQLRQR